MRTVVFVARIPFISVNKGNIEYNVKKARQTKVKYMKD